MKKIKAFIGLQVVNFGLWIYEVNHGMPLDHEDHENLKRLFLYQANFKRKLCK